MMCKLTVADYHLKKDKFLSLSLSPTTFTDLSKVWIMFDSFLQQCVCIFDFSKTPFQFDRFHHHLHNEIPVRNCKNLLAKDEILSIASIFKKMQISFRDKYVKISLFLIVLYSLSVHAECEMKLLSTPKLKPQP